MLAPFPGLGSPFERQELSGARAWLASWVANCWSFVSIWTASTSTEGLQVTIIKSQNAAEMDFLTTTLLEAGAELSRRFGGDNHVRTKADQSLLTDADLASEEVVLGQIRRHFPDDRIYSEEAGLSKGGRPPGSYIWIIDPLDGTTNFANNYPFFCVSIGRGKFRADGSIELVSGGIHDPIRNKTYTATLGGGAFCNGQRLKASIRGELAKSFLVTGFYYQKGQALRREIERFSRVAETCQSIRRDGAAALDLALVAEGVYDAFWELGLAPWDLAAGALLVAEAGGSVVNYHGTESANGFQVEGEGVIAGAPAITAAIGEIIKATTSLT